MVSDGKATILPGASAAPKDSGDVKPDGPAAPKDSGDVKPDGPAAPKDSGDVKPDGPAAPKDSVTVKPDDKTKKKKGSGLQSHFPSRVDKIKFLLISFCASYTYKPSC